jgi:hypothetical protein
LVLRFFPERLPAYTWRASGKEGVMNRRVALPERVSLEWLRKRARTRLRSLRQGEPCTTRATAQLAVAREFGFGSWRQLHREVSARKTSAPPLVDDVTAPFLRAVGAGELGVVAEALRLHPGIVNATGPHPFWGGRPQPLHVATDARRVDMVKLLLRQGADIDGTNDGYDGWSPLLIASVKRQRGVQRMLLRRGAHVGLGEAARPLPQ